MTDAEHCFHNALRQHRAGQFETAEALYHQVLDAQPGHSEALFLLGTLCCQQQRYDTAIHYLQKVLVEAPEHAQAHYNLGVVSHQQGHLDAAVCSYKQALAIQPDYAMAHNNLGVALKAQQQFDEAAAHFTRVLALQPDNAQAHNNLGQVLRQRLHYNDAVACFEQAVALKPDYAEAYYNLGSTLQEQGHIETAIANYQRALQLKPDYAKAYSNLGIILKSLGRFDEAMEHFAHALSVQPNFAEAEYGKALVWLTQGDLDRGWPAYEWRFQTAEQPPRGFPQPRWDGSSLHGRTILVHAERQGVGDAIQFASCLPDIIAQAAHCVIECDQRLAPLFSRSFPTATVHGGQQSDDLSWLSQVPPIDVQMAAGSLARYVRPTLDNFPARTSYLVPDTQRQRQWTQQLATLGPGLKVGIAWRSLALLRHHPCYIDLTRWGAILTVPGAHFVNLQYDHAAKEIGAAQCAWGVPLTTWDDLDLFNDLDDLAALMAALDLVIAPATTVANLAASVGQRVWRLTSFGGSWDLLGTESLPWFPSIRVLRQPRHGDWSSVLVRVADDLACLAQERVASMQTRGPHEHT